jgi:aspartate/ornithine carbamoyltransferase-like protein
LLGYRYHLIHRGREAAPEFTACKTMRPGLQLYFLGNYSPISTVFVTSDITKPMLKALFALGNEMRVAVQRQGGLDLLKSRVLACLFYEPSTRTNLSFQVQ